MIFLSLVKYTLREVFGQKTIILLGLIFTVIICLLVAVVRIHAQGGVIESVGILGKPPISMSELHRMFPQMSQLYVTFLFTATIVICAVATSHIIPEALAEGRNALLLVQPLSRSGILLGKYLGVVCSIGMLQLYLIIGCGVVFSGKIGAWVTGMLLPFMPLILAFSSLYAFMVFLGVATRSAGFTASIALIHVVFLSRLIDTHDVPQLFSSGGSFYFVQVLRYVLPPVQGLQSTAVYLLESQPVSIGPIIGSLSSTVLMLAAADKMFRRMDF
jgi:ABC-type transport system involved in multi-copper enzyme maturation permease subunit